MKNIVLIGMPGCGKSTIGVLLAKQLGMSFVDTDIVIQNRTGKLLYKILEEKGVDGLLDEEQEAILSLDMKKGAVISTGGSAPLREKSMQHLSQNSYIVYLKLPLCDIERRIKNKATRGIAAEKDETLADIYNYRVPFYEKWAQFIIDCSGKNAEENMQKIVVALNLSEI